MKKGLFRKSIIFILAGIMVLSVLSGCGKAKQNGGETENTLAGEITVKGSDTVLPVAQKAAEVYMSEVNKDAIISVTGGGSGVGIAALIDGTTDIANASRPIKDEEVQQAKEKGITPYETKIADDGLSVIVNPQLGVTQLTLAQLKDIYTGKINNWKEVGGPDLKIVAITRDNSSGTYAYFKEKVLEDEEYRADALTEPSNGNIVKTVAQTKGAIGYVGLAYLNNSVVALKVAKEDGAPYVEANLENVKNGSYPISRPLMMYTNGEPKGLVKDFIDFILSDRGQKIVEEIGYIPVK